MIDNYFYQPIINNKKLPFRLLIHNLGGAHTVLRHWHRSFEISFVISGQNPNYYIDGNLFNQQTNEIIVVNPYQVHGLMLPADSQRVSMTIMLPEKFILSCGIEPTDFTIQNCIKKSNEKGYLILVKLFKKLYRSTNVSLKENPDGISHEIGLVYLIVSQLLSNYSYPQIINKANKREIKTKYLLPALQFIDIHYNKNLKVEDLSEVSNVSTSYFAHMFKLYMGETPLTYLNDLRSLRASQLLLNSNESIDNIAEEVGFPNNQALLRAFKKRYNSTPQLYRKSRI